MKALILAAGLGSRLAPLTDQCPKSLVQVNGKPILIKQIENLHKNGITDITIVSGYQAEKLEKTVHAIYPDIHILESRDYAVTNNMYSAYMARNVMGDEGFLMMNADVFFDASVLTALLAHKSPDAIVTDMGRYLEESMKVMGEAEHLTAISKQISQKDALGCSIDVYKFSKEGAQAFFRKCAEYIEGKKERKLWSEVALNDIFSEVKFQACPLVGRWYEIDDLTDLANAEELFSTDADYFGKETGSLRGKKLFLLDMDGTIYEENRLFEGTQELLAQIVRRHGKYVFVTNNSSKSIEEYVEKLKGMGIEAKEDDLFTSTQATAIYLKRQYPEIKVYCQGTKALVAELRDLGIDVTEEVRDDVGLVLVGFDTELTSGKLRNTCELLQRDIPFVATNPDWVCPVSFGFIPDCGSICQMLERATGKRPVFIGKPETEMVHAVLDKYGYSPEHTVIIGDRLYTDIAVGINAGVDTVCVLTGETTAEDIQKSERKPTYTFIDVKEISRVLAEMPVEGGVIRNRRRRYFIAPLHTTGRAA